MDWNNDLSFLVQNWNWIDVIEFGANWSNGHSIKIRF